MVDESDIIAARDAALACLDSLLHASVELEKCWQAKGDTVGNSCHHVAITESCGCGPATNPEELEAFMDMATMFVERIRRHAAAAMDEALTDDVCEVLELARAKAGVGQVTLAGRSYSCCHLAAVDHVARFGLCWPGCFPLRDVMQKLREVTGDIAEELREIAAGIRTEAATAIRLPS